MYARFLLRNGADEIVYPEKQVANWTAIRATAQSIYLTMCSSVTLTLFLRLKCLRTGWERPSWTGRHTKEVQYQYHGSEAGWKAGYGDPARYHAYR